MRYKHQILLTGILAFTGFVLASASALAQVDRVVAEADGIT